MNYNDLFNKDSNNDDNDSFYSDFSDNKTENSVYNKVEDNSDFYNNVSSNDNIYINFEKEETKEENNPPIVLNNNDNQDKKLLRKHKMFKIMFAFLIVIVFSIVSILVLAELKLIKLPWLDYPEVLNLSQNEVMLKRESKFQFSTHVYPSQVHYGRIIFESADPSIADVNPITGYVEAKSNGTTIIKAYLEDYKDVLDTCEVVVSDNNVLVESISVDNENIDILNNSKYILKYSYYPKNAGLHYFIYSSSDNDILSVSNNGEVIALKPGRAMITILDEVSGNSVNQEFTVYDSKDYNSTDGNHLVSSIKVSSSDVDLIVGGEYQVNATVYPENVIQTVTFSSVNPNIATVTTDGLITGVDYGTTQIVATAIDGTNKIIDVTVVSDEVAVTGIRLVTNSMTIPLSDTKRILYEIEPSKATNQKVLWTSSDASIVSIDAGGNLEGVNSGTATITATTDDGNFTAQMIVNVIKQKISVSVNDLQLSKTSVSLNVGQTVTVNATVSPSNASNKKVIWTTSNGSVASVSNGMIYAKSGGTATIRATTQDGQITKTVNVVVKSSAINSISLSSGSVKLGIGGVTQLYVTYSPTNASGKSVTWSTSNGSVASVSNGLVYAKSVGTARIVATTPNGKTAVCVVTVTNEKVDVQNIELSNKNYIVKVNGTTGATPIITPSHATVQTVTWSIGDSSIATVTSDGKIRGVREGVTSVKAKTNNGKTASSFVIVKNNNPPAYYLDGTSIKYWVDTSYKNYAITHIWVNDPYTQFKTEIPDKFGSLASPSTLMQKASKKNPGKAIIGINASGFVTESFSAPLYNVEHKWKNTSVSPLVVYEGNVIRDYTTISSIQAVYNIYGMDSSGNLRYIKYSSSGANNTNVKSNTLNAGIKYTFGWKPVLVFNGKTNDEYLTSDVTIRQSICQQDSHNFIFISNITSNRSKGFSTASLAKKMVELKCQTGFNLDGGGSISIYQVKKGSNKPSKVRVMEGDVGRSIPDILYFVGD